MSFLRQHSMRGVHALACLLACCATAASTCRAAEQSADPAKPTVIVLVGAPGEADYGADFAKSADAWTDACKRANVNFIMIGREGVTTTAPATAPATKAATPAAASQPATPAGKTDRQRFQDALQAEAKGTQPLWLVFIGHGTFDGKEAKFNLRDLDFSDADLAGWLKPMSRPIAVIDCSSASATFLNKVSAPGRVVVTATRSGTEVNYARFGIYMAQAIADPTADIDRDGQTSLLEAFLAAARRTADFYQTNGRVATEHPILDDNGDAQGVAAEWFDGTRATRSARGNAPIDGARAGQWFLIPSPEEAALTSELRSQRDALELRIESLRQKKATLSEKDYYTQLDGLLVTLAKLQAGPSTPK